MARRKKQDTPLAPARAENQNVEYKESWRDEYLKWVCGFANAQGGVLRIGVRDDGRVVGVADGARLLTDIPNKIRDTMGIIADVNLREEAGREYVEIRVSPSSYPVSYHGEYHYRSGSTKQQLRGAALTEFLVRKTGYRWDAVPVDRVSVADLDQESFDIFRREAVRAGRMAQIDVGCSNAELLEKLGLTTEGKLKRAAVLLFHRHPQRFFTGTYVKIGRFGVGADLRYQDTVEGSLMLQADRTVELIYLKYLKARIAYDKEVRVETYPFAREAVREAVYNALVHCKWEDGTPIQIRIEDGAMRIFNTCAFPGDWTVETLMQTHASRPHNHDLANTFYRAGYIESWGRGIQKICDECRAIGAPLPEYEVLGDGLTVRFPALFDVEMDGGKDVEMDAGKGAADTLDASDSLEERILELLAVDNTLTAPHLAEKLQVTARTVERIIKHLREQGRISRKGGRRHGYWELT